MGLWDFVKSAGKALGIGEADAAQPPAPEALKKEVKDLGLKAEGLKVTVDGESKPLFAAVVIPKEPAVVRVDMPIPGLDRKNAVEYWSANLADTDLRDEIKRGIDDSVRRQEYARRGIEPRVTWQNIESIRAGMRKDEVLELLGPPREITRLPRQQRDVWEYPWWHANREKRVLFVQFSDDGVARETIERHDYQDEPENSRN